MVQAKTFISESKVEQTQMVELFTSDSCSSCPPANVWLSKFKSHPLLWKKLIPVAFHVDYWNHLSWKDPLSDPLMTERQKNLVRLWKNPISYTPAVMINGEELRKWYDQKEIPNSTEKVPFILSLSHSNKEKFYLELKNVSKSNVRPARIRMALLGFGIVSKVTDGENAGVTLKHDFVVLDWAMQKVENKTSFEFSFKKPQFKTTQLAVVAWAEIDSSERALQITGGYL
jgi:hypothetical protein